MMQVKETGDLRDSIALGIWLWQGGYDRKKGIVIGKTAIVRANPETILLAPSFFAYSLHRFNASEA